MSDEFKPTLGPNTDNSELQYNEVAWTLTDELSGENQNGCQLDRDDFFDPRYYQVDLGLDLSVGQV